MNVGRSQRECLAVLSTDLVSPWPARTSHTGTRCPVRSPRLLSPFGQQWKKVAPRHRLCAVAASTRSRPAAVTLKAHDSEVGEARELLARHRASRCHQALSSRVSCGRLGRWPEPELFAGCYLTGSNNRKSDHTSAGKTRNVATRRIRVSEPLGLSRPLRDSQRGFPFGKPWRMPVLA